MNAVEEEMPVMPMMAEAEPLKPNQIVQDGVVWEVTDMFPDLYIRIND